VNNLAGVPSIVFGVFAVGFFIHFVGGTIDRLFFPSPCQRRPWYGRNFVGLLTLALLTVPVVIVPLKRTGRHSWGMREASLALGATKFETTMRVVLPSVMPSILTG
jgi:phosphate transport system permease protein